MTFHSSLNLKINVHRVYKLVVQTLGHGSIGQVRLDLVTENSRQNLAHLFFTAVLGQRNYQHDKMSFLKSVPD